MDKKKRTRGVFASLFAAALCVCPFFGGAGLAAAAEESARADFSDGFENYVVSGNYIEDDKTLTSVWDNNVFRGGEAVGMDAHIKNVGKIEYENGSSGNKVLHLKNTSGADTFFYMGPNGDYRVRNFTVEFKVKFLTEGVAERSWAGISFRKKSNVYYTGTNNLLLFVQRYAEAATVTGHAFAVFDGGAPGDLAETGGLYGDKLAISRQPYSVPGGAAHADLPWLTVKLEAEGNTYRLYADDHKVTECTFDIPKFDYYGYLSLNCCTSNILVDDFSVKVDDETPPPEILPLPAPVVSLDAENKKISWEPVLGSSAYLVKAGDAEKTVYACEYSLDKLTAGTYEITVTALSDDTFEALNSSPSSAVTFTAGGKSPEASGSEKKGCASAAGGGAVLGAGLIAAPLFRRKEKRGGKKNDW